jgi:hypothetical protein
MSTAHYLRLPKYGHYDPDHSEDICVDGRIILKGSVRNRIGVVN